MLAKGDSRPASSTLFKGPDANIEKNNQKSNMFDQYYKHD